MDVQSGKLYWPAIHKKHLSYPSVDTDIECDILIIGGGITGALICYTMSQLGINVVLVDKHKIGSGSTSATTALIQYDSDIDLFQLISLIGKKMAVTNHTLCLDAINKLEVIIKQLQIKNGFSRKKSLYIASNKKDLSQIHNEFITREKNGFHVEFLDNKNLKDVFNITAPGGLLSANAAQIDPLKITYALINAAQKNGVKIYEDTLIKNYIHQKNSVFAQTKNGSTIHAKKIIFATGFAAEEVLKKKVAKLTSTYALATIPLSTSTISLKDVILWETKRPYLYARTTDDNRLIIGGEDEEFFDPKKRDRLIETKAKRIIKKFNKYFPLGNVKIDYKWAGTFGETKDSLPYIGESKDFPNAYFALAYGGNGIVFSVIAAEIIRDLYLKKKNKYTEIYKFGR